MEKIWAPWRMEYIESSGDKTGCFLCDAFASLEDRANLVLARRKHAFLLMNRYPYTNGHLMAVPIKHTGDLDDLSPAELTGTMELVNESVRALREVICAQGFNIGINLGAVAGAGMIDHVHIHIVPRWLGDTNFMPVLGETKVISEHLLETYDKLKSSFE
ncbi:HIT domain-containing protein [bacterium]|nr:HIT domain-containing protein [bacterium]